MMGIVKYFVSTETHNYPGMFSMCDNNQQTTVNSRNICSIHRYGIEVEFIATYRN